MSEGTAGFGKLTRGTGDKQVAPLCVSGCIVVTWYPLVPALKQVHTWSLPWARGLILPVYDLHQTQLLSRQHTWLSEKRAELT